MRFDHLDYHEGILVMYGPFFEVVKELAREHGVPVRQPTPESVFGHVKWPGRAGGAVTMRKMVAFAARHPVLAWRLMPHVSPSAFRARAATLQADGIAAPNWFIDGYFGRASVENFIAMLRQLPPGVSEVATHPGLVDEQLRALGGGYVDQREVELRVLLEPRVRAALDESDIALVDYSCLARSRRPSATAPSPGHGPGDGA